MISTIAGLLLALGAPSLLAYFRRSEKNSPGKQVRRLTTAWACCLALLALVLCWEQRPLASIGIAAGNHAAWLGGAALGLTMLALSVVSVVQARRMGKEDTSQGLMQLTEMPLWFRCAVPLTAGITEEIMFRGYPIERLHELTGSWWLAALIPLAVFTLAHLGSWSWKHLIGVGLAGTLLTGLYLWQRDLIACMIAHALIDSVLIFLPALRNQRFSSITASR
ncbi:CPBP family intramembrane glutamic endopeptidase [Duganella sp.]|uniref:CPBP family intramembrane glutamic endopeptidase n=1 Tax=Duganella sp. TaxID=1904440 RepID=UPI0031D7F074